MLTKTTEILTVHNLKFCFLSNHSFYENLFNLGMHSKGKGLILSIVVGMGYGLDVKDKGGQGGL